MLYDLENDPKENENIANDPEHAGTVKTMRRLLKKRMDEAASAALGKPPAVEKK